MARKWGTGRLLLQTELGLHADFFRREVQPTADVIALLQPGLRVPAGTTRSTIALPDSKPPRERYVEGRPGVTYGRNHRDSGRLRRRIVDPKSVEGRFLRPGACSNVARALRSPLTEDRAAGSRRA